MNNTTQLNFAKSGTKFYASFVSTLGLLLLFLSSSLSFGQTNSYLGTNGGFEGAATIDNTTLSSTPVANVWGKSTATATIASETTTVRSGSKSLKVTSSSSTLCRVFSPQVTISASTTVWQVQYYRRAASTTNTVQNQTGNIRGGTEQTNGAYSSVSAANTWEKVTYSPASTTSATTAASVMLVKVLGTGTDMFYDDFVLYEGAADNTAPSAATTLVFSGQTSSAISLSWTAASGGVDGGGYIVVRGTTDPTTAPNVNGVYAVGNTIGTGTVVYSGTGTTFNDTGLTAGTTYFYRVYTFDKAYNYAAALTGSSATTVTAITSNASGNWSSTATWVGGVVPTSTDSVIIASGHTVTMDSGTYSTRNSGTTTTVNVGGTLATNLTYTNSGTTTINGTFQINAGGYASGTDLVYGAGGTLVFAHNNGSSYGASNGAYWPATSGPVNVTLNSNSPVTLGFARTVSGTFTTSAALTTASNLTLTGTCQINSTSASFDSSVNYSGTTNLIYNCGGTMGRANEWGNTSSPTNVTLQASTTLNYPNGWGAITRSITGVLTINTGSALYMDYGSPATGVGALTVGGNLVLAGSLSLGNQSGGDLLVGGNWTNTGTFTPNGRAVTFNGAGTQIITNASGETFAYLINNKSAGTLQLANNVTVNANSSNPLQMLNAGTVDLNGKTLTLSNAGGSILVSGGVRTILSSVTGGVLAVTGSKSVTSASTGTLVFGATANPSFSTLILSSGFDFGSSLTTINSTLQINGGGFANTNAPIYANTSTLVYNGVTGYGVGNEWTGNTTTAGTGNPQNVTLTTSSVNMPASSGRALAGVLTIGTGSTLTLGTSVGGDLTIGGNFSNSGTFNASSRLTTFGGITAQTLTGATTFDYLKLNNSTGLTLNNNIVVTTNLDLTSGKLTLGTNNLTLNSGASITNASATNYIVTNGTGRVVKAAVGNTAFTFPIGLNTTNYTPVAITNTTGTSDLSVNVGSTITNAVYDATRIVNLQWSVTSSAATTATVVPTWVAANQAASFTNTGTGEVGIYTTAYLTTPVTLNTTTTSASGLAFQNGSNLIVVGNSNAVVCSTPIAPTVTTQPTNTTLIAATTNNTASFTIAASGATAYQWQYSTTAGGTYANVATGTPTGLTYTTATTATLNISSNSNTAGGTYYYRCIVTGTCGATSTTNVGMLTVYCGSAATNTGFEYISNVTVAGGINQTSANTTYTNYYATQTATITQGQNLTVTVTGTGTASLDAAYVLADWNQDGDFADAGEVSTPISGAGPVYNVTITVPATATLGKTRMRIKFGDTVSTTAMTAAPCQTFTYGEVEDYGLLVTVASPPTITSLSATTGCAGGSITINGTNLNGVTASNVTIGGTAVASITSNTATQIVAVIGSGTTGTVQVTTAGGTATSVDTFTVNPVASAVWASTTTAVCFSASAQTTPLAYTSTSGSPTLYSITWNSSPTNTFAAVTNQANTFNSGSGTISISVPAGTATGTYTGTITVSNTFGCVSGASTFTVTVNPVPTATASNSGPYCQGSTIQLTGGLAGASNYAWTGPNGYSVSGGASAGLNENFDGTVTGWSFTGASVSTAQVCSGTKSVLFAAVNQTAITPSVTNPNQLTFSIVRSGTATPAMSIAVQISDANPVSQTSGPWTTITTVGSTSASTCTSVGPFDLSSYTGIRYVRFLDTRASGTQQRDIDDVVLTTLAPSMSPSIANATTAMSGVYTLTVTNASGCTATATTTVTVDATTVAGTVSSDQTICSGATPSALTLNGYTGSIVKWQSASDLAFTTGVADITNTTATLTLGALTTTTYYRAVVKNGSCLTVNSNVVTITVNPTTVAGTVASSQTICYNTAANLTLSGNVGSVVKWQKADDAAFTLNVTDVSNTTTSLNTGALTQTTYYRAVVQSGVCLVATSNIVTVTVKPNTTITTQPVSQTVCAGTSVTFSVVAANSPGGYLYQWKKNGNTISGATNDTYTISSTTAADAANYTVEVLGDCGPVVVSTIAALTVNPNHTIALTSGSATSTVCQNTAITTPIVYTVGGGATGAGVTGLPSGMSGTFSGSTLTLNGAPTAVGTFNYTVTTTGNSCTVATASGTITVNGPVTPTFTAVAPICAGASLSALPTTSNNGYTGTWAPALDNANTTTYTFTPTAGQCATTATLTITVNPNVTPTFTAVAPICAGASLSALPTTSNNGYTGTWSPTLDNTTTTTYTFTPTAGQCATTATLTITVNPNVTPTFTAVAPICAGASLSALPTTSNNSITGTWAPALDNTTTTTYTFTPTAGQCATTTTLTITVNPNVTPTFTAVAPICSGASLSALPTTSNNGYTGTWSPALNNTATTTYTFTPDAGQCATTTTLTITVGGVVTWNGTAWDNVTGPTSTDAVVFTGNYTVSSDLTACSVTVNGGVVTVDPGKNVYLSGSVTVTTGSLTFNSSANLMQSNPNAVNTGNIIVKRNSKPLMRLDYTAWSSPVAGQELYAFSPFTFANRFYVYDSPTNLYSNSIGATPLLNVTGTNTAGVNGTDTYHTQFATGRGYLIRVPYNHPTAPAVWTGSFTGVPNNGTQTFSLVTQTVSTNGYNLVGNPYPSDLSIAQFAADNASNIEETLYFWRKTNNPNLASYCTWNTSTHSFTSNVAANASLTPATTAHPYGVIGVGQGFIVQAKNGASSLVFNNGQRTVDSEDRFFRPGGSTTATTTTESHRIWLNMTGATDEFSQTLVGYFTDGTLGMDATDSKFLNDGTIAINTKVGAETLVMQGRPVPFDASDVVPLNYKVTNAGTYTFAIDHADGLFAGGAQTVYIKDNTDGSYHDITSTPFSFTSAAGTFDTRFELVYQNLLSNDSNTFSANSINVIRQSNHDVVVNTSMATMSSVRIFDIRGRLLVEKKDINANETRINVGTTNQVLLVEVVTKEGYRAVRKVVN